MVVFVTAYEEHAVRAFEVHALDYLLKPFEYDRLYPILHWWRGPGGPAAVPAVNTAFALTP